MALYGRVFIENLQRVCPERVILLASQRYAAHPEIQELHIDNVLVKNLVYCKVCKKLIATNKKGLYNIGRHSLTHGLNSPFSKSTRSFLQPSEDTRSDPKVVISGFSGPTSGLRAKLGNQPHDPKMPKNEGNKRSYSESESSNDDELVIKKINDYHFDEDDNKVADVIFEGRKYETRIPFEDVEKYNKNNKKVRYDITDPHVAHYISDIIAVEKFSKKMRKKQERKVERETRIANRASREYKRKRH